MKLVNKVFSKIKLYALRRRFPYISNSALIYNDIVVYNPHNLIMEDNTNINPGAVILNTNAKFILKKGSGAARGLTVSTGNHMSIPGFLMKDISQEVKEKYDVNREYNKDVVVEEDVWIASNVTLLSGVILGRGSEVGAGAVVRKSIPPYALVVGNPAKIVGFRFTPEEIIEHEKVQYEESERLPFDLLQKNYEKYFLNRIKDIKQFTKL